MKADRRAFLSKKRDQLKKDMTHDVKGFWKRFKKGKPTAALHNVEQWSAYFDKLFNDDKRVWQSEEDFENHCGQFGDIFGNPTDADVEDARGLNIDFKDDEVIRALKAMKLGKAVGADRIPVEFIRQAYHEVKYIGEDGKPRAVREYLLIPYLTPMFQKIVTQGYYPPGWAVGVVTPVPKPKGDSTIMDNYRAITVGVAISKVFAQVILERLDDWAEKGGWRAPTQFGFRKGRGTSEAVFMLRHLVDKSQHQKKPLFSAFIDFKKAYDSVPRELLWKSLGKMGIHGPILDILQQMYNNVKLQVRVDNEFGPDFESSVGVKQGDPLSPLLFGLYIDRFTTFLRERCPEGDIWCGEEMVQMLLYADDLVLVSHDPFLLQKYLDILDTFCCASGMNVNVAKSEIVVFFQQWAAKNLKWKLNRKEIKQSKEFVYLGVIFQNSGFNKKSVNKAVKRRADKARSPCK